MSDRHDWLVLPGQLEIRKRGTFYSMSGSFPYSTPGSTRGTATVSDRGRRRKESFSPGAFSFAVNEPTREIHLLAGHSFDKPLASKLSGSLTLKDTPAALTFIATLPDDPAQPTYMADTIRQIDAGLAGGISPGFRVPPPDVVPDAEELIPEPGNPDVLIRQINAAVLFELSVVTRPAYGETELQLDRRAAQETRAQARLRRTWL